MKNETKTSAEKVQCRNRNHERAETESGRETQNPNGRYTQVCAEIHDTC